MDPDKRLTCGQLLQHQYFDGFNNEFDRERKERQKLLDREQQKLLQQQAKLQNNVYVSNTKQQNPGVSLLTQDNDSGPRFRGFPAGTRGKAVISDGKL